MRLVRRVLSWAAIAALLGSAACGGDAPSPTPSATATATQTAMPSRTEAATPVPHTATTTTALDTRTPTPSSTPPATATPTDVPPRPTATPTPTSTPSLTPSITATATASATATAFDPCDEQGTICTIAGTGLSQFDGDGKPALETSFYYPLDIDFDAQGRVLILDWNNLRLRRLNSDGTIETVMGNDTEAFPVDGALAKDTSLHHPSDVEKDAAGRMFVAGNHVPVVFRVDSDQRVFTVAGSDDFGNDGDGGPARSAKLSEPYGVKPDASGGFYISDATANVVRYVDAGAIIHTVAGNGERGYGGDGGPATQAQLDGPTRLQTDVDGDLYFCDTDNHVVRRLRDGVITTVAGTGQPGYSGDGGPAEQAQLNAPYDLRFSPAGDLYVADTGNNVIRRVDANGVVTTVVGSGAQGFDGDGGEARAARLNRPSGINFSADGSLWIADTFNQRVRRVARFLSDQTGTPGPTRTRRPTSPPTSTPTATPTGVPPEDAITTIAGTGIPGLAGDGGPATEAMLNSPVQVAVRPSGDVIIVDFGNHCVRAVDANTGVIRTIAGNGLTEGDEALPFPTDVVFASDGSFFVSSWGTNQVYQYLADGTRRVVAGNGQPVCDANVIADATAASLRLPRGLQITRSGGLLISEQGCHRLRLLDAGGLSTFAGTGVAGYSGDGGPPEEAQFSSRTSPLRPIPNFGIGLSPESIADELYVADTGNNVIREIKLLVDLVYTFAGTGGAGLHDDSPPLATFDRPNAVFVTPDHAVWIADGGNHAIRRVDPFRIGVVTLAGTGEAGYNGDGLSASVAKLNGPGGLFVTSEGDVYVADTGNHRVRKFRFVGRR